MTEQKNIKDTELAKIEIYSEQCNTSVGILASAAIAFIVGFSVLFWKLSYSKTINPTTFTLSLVTVNAVGYYFLWRWLNNYDKEKKNISDMIEYVKQGNELCPLSKLAKWKKEDQK